MVVAPGDAVVLHGLPSFQGFNGRRGRVEQLVAGDTYHVRLSGGLRVQVLSSHLDPIEVPEISSESESSEEEDADPVEGRRSRLVKDFFTLLDPDNKQLLRAGQTYHLAKACGFQESREEWDEEYEALCKLCDVSDGFSAKDFERLLSDQALPTYCSTSELPSLMEQASHSWAAARLSSSLPNSRRGSLETVASAKVKRRSGRSSRSSRSSTKSTSGKRGSFKGRTRLSLKQEKVRKTIQASQERRDAIGFIFHTLDADDDERLNLQEMERFACLCGFAGEWADEYEVMCEVLKINTARGVDFLQFDRLVADEKSHAYCSDEEIREMVLYLKSERQEIASSLAAIRIQAGARGFLTRSQVRRSMAEMETGDADRSHFTVPQAVILPEPPAAPWSDDEG